MATNISKFISGSGFGSYNHRYNNSVQFRKMTERLKNATSELNYGKNFSISRYIYELNASKELLNTITIPPTEETSILTSPEGQAVANLVQEEAAVQFLKMFYGLYMSPTKSDMEWRLGNVTGSVPVLKRTPQTTAQGLMYTASNFNQTFNVKSYSPWSSKAEFSYKETFSNMWFPPFTNNGKLGGQASSLNEWVDLRQKVLKGDESAAESLDGKVDGTYFDMNSMIDYRGMFTYRDVAFKPINDNIMFMQWLFERVSGVVSTYLTDWDLSVYMQEGLLTKGNNTPKYISLTHRMADDAPISGMEVHAYNFGVINAAVSKLFNSNKEKWDPSMYPLSPFWQSYPAWAKRKSQYRMAYSDEYDRYIPTPMFYWHALDSATGTRPNRSFLSRIQFDDFQGAALAGWTSWQLYYWKALYCNDGDGLTEADVLAMAAGSGWVKNKKIINENFYANWKIDMEGVQEEEDDTYSDMAEAVEASVSSDMGSSGGGSSYKSGGRAAAKLMKSRSSKNNAALRAAQNAGLGNALGMGSASDDTEAAAKTFLGVDDKSIDSAKGTGICQRTPALFGGPHGVSHSPLTVQSYLEANNTWLRNVPRLAPNGKTTDSEYNLLSLTSDKVLGNFKGAEKWFASETHYVRGYKKHYEHSFSEGMEYMNKGLSCYNWCCARTNVTHVGWFPGRMVSNGCTSWPVWDSYVGGHRIRYGEHGTGSGCGCWHWRWWTMHLGRNGYNIVSNFEDGTSNAWTAYLGDSSRWWWAGDWYVTTLSPCRYGYYTAQVVTWYKKYFLHSEPTIYWKIHKVQMSKCQVAPWWRSGLWGIFCMAVSWLFGGPSLVSTASYTSYDEYRLTLPGSVSRSKSYVSRGKNFFYSLPLTHTRNEDKVAELMIDLTGRGKSADVIFLEGNYSYSDRMRNGPMNIFRCPVSHKDYQYVYWVKKSKRCFFRKKKTWYEPRTAWDDYLSVKVHKCDCYFSNTSQKSPKFTNNYASADFIKASTVKPWSAGRCDAVDLEDRLRYIGSSRTHINGEKPDRGYYGIEGYGLLGCIPALDANIQDNPPYEMYRSKLQVMDPRRYDRRLMDTQFNYYKIYNKGSNRVYYNGRWWSLPNGGMPSVWTYRFDEGLRKAWINACTRGTFYIDEQLDMSWNQYKPNLKHYWSVPIDVSFRVFYNQLLYQRSYLDVFEEFFCGKVKTDNGMKYVFDFDAMNKIIAGDGKNDGLISKKVYTLADPVNTTMVDPDNPDTRCNKHEIYGYNQWIVIARQWFCNSPARNAQKRATLQNLINRRKAAFDNAINYFRPFVKNDIKEFSYNQYLMARQQVSDVQESITNNSALDEFFYAYLNVLYEYRRFFINKRCNKEDGTLWQMRCLESMLPMVINSQNVKAPVSPSAFSSPSYNVAFYEIQNSVLKKTKAALEKRTLDYDRVKTVYVKVEYTTEDAWKESCEKLKNGEIDEPTVVRVRYWYYPKNDDGTFKKDANGKPYKKYGKGYKYVKKPVNGVYRLESTEFLDNLAKINYNETATDGKLKVVDPSIEEAHWYIKWGTTDSTIKSEIGETDILFDVYCSIDVGKAVDLVNAGVNSPTDLLCGSKVAQDYWTVKVKTNLPRAVGYKTSIKLVPYLEDGTIDSSIENALCGVSTSLLYPITEEQEFSEPLLGDVAAKISAASN